MVSYDDFRAGMRCTGDSLASGTKVYFSVSRHDRIDREIHVHRASDGEIIDAHVSSSPDEFEEALRRVRAAYPNHDPSRPISAYRSVLIE